MGNFWPDGGHRSGSQAFRGGAVALPLPDYTGLPEYARHARDMAGKYGKGLVRFLWFEAVRQFYRHVFDDFIEPATRFQVPNGWTTICKTSEPNLQGNPQWPVWPGANACSFGGAVVPGDFYSPPPPGYEGYGAPMVWESFIPGYRMGIVTPTKALQGSGAQIWFHYWHGFFTQAVEADPPTDLPGYRATFVPARAAAPPLAPPYVERGPFPFMPPGWTMSPGRPIVIAWPFAFPGVRPIVVPGVTPRPSPRPHPPTVPVVLPRPPVVLPGTVVVPLPAYWSPGMTASSYAATGFYGKPAAIARNERKWKTTGTVSQVMTSVGIVTEFVDLFQAVWYAMDKKQRAAAYRFFGGKPTFLQRVQWMFWYSDKIDWAAAMYNFAVNSSGDTQAASGGKFTREMHKRMDEMGLPGLRSRGPIETWNRLKDHLQELDLFAVF